VNRRNVLKGTVLAVAGGAGIYAMNRRDWFADHMTGIGERRTVTLPDNSTVELGSYSALSVDYESGERRTRLYRGEGYFDVTSSNLPFIVEAGNGSVQALGTQFDVKSVDDLVTVTVSERKVRINVDGRAGLDIDQGQQVSYSRGGVGAVNTVDIDAAIAWRKDRIVFQDVPLRRVLAELQRYRRGRIMLMESSLGDIPVTAVFNTRQADRALQTIAETLPIRVFQATDYVAVVYRAS
jgi:transmembrane sensor